MSFRSTSLIFIFSYLYFCTYIMSPIILLADKNIIGVYNDPKDYYLYISLVLSFFIYFFIILGYIGGAKTSLCDEIKCSIKFEIILFSNLIQYLFFCMLLLR